MAVSSLDQQRRRNKTDWSAITVFLYWLWQTPDCTDQTNLEREAAKHKINDKNSSIQGEGEGGHFHSESIEWKNVFCHLPWQFLPEPVPACK